MSNNSSKGNFAKKKVEAQRKKKYFVFFYFHNLERFDGGRYAIISTATAQPHVATAGVDYINFDAVQLYKGGGVVNRVRRTGGRRCRDTRTRLELGLTVG